MNKKDFLALKAGDKIRLHKTFTNERAKDDAGYKFCSLTLPSPCIEPGTEAVVAYHFDKKRGLLTVEHGDSSRMVVTRRLIRKKLESEAVIVEGVDQFEPGKQAGTPPPELTKAVAPPGYRLLADDEVIKSGDLWWNGHHDAVWEPADGVIGGTLKKLRYASDPELHTEFVNRSACRTIPTDAPDSNEWRDMGPDEVLRGGDYFWCGNDWHLVIGLDGASVRHTYSQRGRRKVVRYEPAPQYRLLDDGEVILETDRFGFAEIPSSETLLRAPRDWMGVSINPIVSATPKAVRESCERFYKDFFVVREHPE